MCLFFKEVLRFFRGKFFDCFFVTFFYWKELFLMRLCPNRFAAQEDFSDIFWGVVRQPKIVIK